MRHRKKGRKLNRTTSHRKALVRNLANQLMEHKEIKTTTEKAKFARIKVEKLITLAKKGDLHHRRLVFGFLRHKSSVKILFDEIAPAFEERKGGYTRVLKLGRRAGDGASMSLLQLVGFEKLTDSTKTEKKKKSTKKTKTSAAKVETADEKSVEQVSADEETSPKTDEVKDQKQSEEEKK
jgi:large subunit ribosomal protein L17